MVFFLVEIKISTFVEDYSLRVIRFNRTFKHLNEYFYTNLNQITNMT